MKKSILRVTAILMIICTLCSASILSSFAASTAGTDYNIIYYTKDGKNTGIKSIKEKGTTFYDCTNNTKANVTTDFLKDYLTTSVTYTEPNGKNGRIMGSDCCCCGSIRPCRGCRMRNRLHDPKEHR